MVVVVLGGALLITGQRANSAADASIARALGAAQSAIDDALASSRQELLKVTAVLALQPPYIAAIDGALRAGDRATLLNQADEFQELTGADWVLITDPDGILAAWTYQRDVFGLPLGEGALVGLALLEGRPTSGLWIEVGPGGEDVLFQAVGVPILTPGGGSLVGSFVAASAVDSAFVAELARHTNTEVAFFSLDTLGMALPAVSTVSDPSLIAALSAFKADSAFAAGTGASWLRFAVDGDELVGTMGPLNSAAGFPLGGYVALRSRATELAPFTQLRQSIFLAFGAGLVLALLSSLLVARRITRPVRRLVEATRGVSEGEFSGTIDVTSRDEIGDLANAFRRMLRELQEKQQLVDYLQQAAAQTVQLTAATPGATGMPAGTRVAAPPQRTGELRIGAVLSNRYEIKKVLGSGGMGVVYRAHDRELDEAVALKTLRAEAMQADATMLERFKQEIRLARRITHRFVVRTHDLGQADGVYFITMEYVEGTNLKELIRKSGKLPLGVCLTVGKQLCRALEVAHEEGIIHRDIKPQNIAVDPAGFIKVMDFGIARLAQRSHAPGEGLTDVGTTVGTPDYMSPEQLLGEVIDGRADLYAAGAVLFECLTGRTVFPAPTLAALMTKHIDEPAPDPRTLNPDVPETLAAVVLRALAKQRDERWPNALAFHDALEDVLVAAA